VAVADGNLTKNVNKTGVRLWTDPSLDQDRKVSDGSRSAEVRSDKPTPFDVRYTLDGYIRFTHPDGFLAVKRPWGTLIGIDMNRSAIAWQCHWVKLLDRG
jgi:hypothetical protein